MSDADYGLKIEKPYRKNRLQGINALGILFVLICVFVSMLFVQRYIQHDEANRYQSAVSAIAISVENSVSASISDEDAKNAPVNINTADVQELCRLSGIGEAKAVSIVDYRINNGPFTYKEELMKVSGIGERLYEKIAPQIVLRDKAEK